MEDLAARARGVLRAHPDQLKRFMRMHDESFYLLGARCYGGGARASAAAASSAPLASFDVSGSTGAPYSIRLLPDGALKCSCPDTRANCGARGCVCKHVCFVLTRVLHETDLAFFGTYQRLRLDAEALGRAARRAEDLADRFAAADVAEDDRTLLPPPGRPAVVAQAPGAVPRWQRQRPPPPLPPPPVSSFAPRRLPGPEDDCPVCYEKLLQEQEQEGAKPCVGCPECGNALHEDCARRWLRHAAHPSCVYCRSGVWAAFPF